MRGCNQAGITDAVCVHLNGILSLNMLACDQAGITQVLRDSLPAAVPTRRAL